MGWARAGGAVDKICGAAVSSSGGRTYKYRILTENFELCAKEKAEGERPPPRAARPGNRDALRADTGA